MARAQRLVCTLAVAGAIMVSPASAADMAPRAPVYKAPPAEMIAYSWSGLYIGGHAGYGWQKTSDDLSGTVAAAAIAAGLIPASLSLDPHGFIGGGQIGYNWHWTPHWLVGIEADFSGADIKGSRSVTIPLQPGNPFNFTTTAEQKLDWFGTVRGRFGYVHDRLLLYATGGLGYGHASQTTQVLFAAAPICAAGFCGLASKTLTGWTIGGGLEWAFAGNWSAKAEYLYYDLGDLTAFATNPLANGVGFFGTTDFKGHIVRGGINYRFGGPVAARY